ncbi:hypothetical protein [Sporolactobacillus laevolacticus]|uniref:hypothetical protein n=1 Tax=Sporolactobacillus laevolacticus TaxID=33018 RepID=UPI0025B5489C|nr:hypothetical protein [Sporolactobacillus laevolacticus]MDN3956359.1 hypothetical protein [Sporolactobacillus laevolacticus]
MGKYSVSTSGNDISVVCEGVFTMEDAAGYVEEFKKAAAKVNPATAHLELDGSGLRVSSQEMVGMLTNIIAMYKEMGFNDITMNLGKSAVLNMQIKRLAKEAGLTQFKLI